jgi:hypothetical protein
MKKDEGADDEVEEKVQFPTFGDTVAGFEAVWRYSCSFAHHLSLVITMTGAAA